MLQFENSMYSTAVPETGTDLDGTEHPRPADGFLTVECADSGDSVETITYDIMSGSSVVIPFLINPTNGELRAIADLDYEERTSYTFMVTCSGFSSLSGSTQASATVEITIQPINEFRPIATLVDTNVPSMGILVFQENGVSIGDLIASPNSDGDLLVSPSSPNSVILLTASDMDAGEDGVLSFSLGGFMQPLFNIEPVSGNVTFAQQPDADIPVGFQVVAVSIEACDPSNQCYTSNSIVIYFLAANDNLPMFAEHDFAVNIKEDDPNTVGVVVANASCTDGDVGIGALVGIEFLNPSSQVTRHFIIADPKKGIIFLNHTIDYEEIQSIGFMVRCLDNVGNTDTATVAVNVLPRNDNPPTFSQVSYNFSVSRTAPDLFHVGTVVATDKDRDVGGDLEFSLQVNPYFDINTLGMIRLINSIQNATASFVLLTISISDGMFSETTVVNIQFTDGNFEEPVFVSGTPVVSVSELTPIGAELFAVQCNDTEMGLNGLISYSIVSGNTGGALEIDSNTGSVRVASPLILGENQTSAQYFVTFRCSDHGVPVFSDLSSGLVIVFKDDTSQPSIGNDTIVAFVNENAPFGSVVVTIIATDNETKEFMFQLQNLTVPNAFNIEPTSGDVILTSILDRETVSFYRMVVIATEQLPEGTVAPVKSDSADLIIYIRDINDNAPVCGVFVTAVDIEPELELGSMIINLNCSDADTGLNANISYSLEDSYGVLDVNTNGILFLANPLEQANRTALNVRIQATDMGSPSLSTEVNILIRIRSENDHSPAFTNLPTTVIVSESAALFSFLFRVTAEDPDKGMFGIIRFRLENETMLPFTLAPNTGELFVTSKLNFYAQSEYTLNISAFDPQFTVYSTLQVSITDANEFSPQCNPIIINQPISEAIPLNMIEPIPLLCSDSDIGSFGNLSYTIVSGNTDNTFSVDSSGAVKATTALDYETTQQYTLIVQVSDGGSPPRSQNVTVSVSVVPSNEFTPVVTNDSYSLTLQEGATIGSTILSVMASDGDSGADGQLSFSR